MSMRLRPRSLYQLLGSIVILCYASQPLRAGQSDLAGWHDAPPETVRSILTLGRSAFEAYALRRETIDPPANLPHLLDRRAAVFVSAMVHGAPRCCMGTLYPAEPDAAREIIASAVAAAGRDRRFAPVKPTEVQGLTLIVSVLSPPRPITENEAKLLDPTLDGLAVRYGDRYGVVLSCETGRIDRMIAWARVRSGAPAKGHVEYYRFRDVRFVEPARTGPQKPGTRS